MRLKYLKYICGKGISRKELLDQLGSAPDFIIRLMRYHGERYLILITYSKVCAEVYSEIVTVINPDRGIEGMSHDTLLYTFDIFGRNRWQSSLSRITKRLESYNSPIRDMDVIDVYNYFLIYKKRVECRELNDKYPYLKTIEYLKGIEKVDVSIQYLYLLANLTALKVVNAKNELEQLNSMRDEISIYLDKKVQEYRLKLISEIWRF